MKRIGTVWALRSDSGYLSASNSLRLRVFLGFGVLWAVLFFLAFVLLIPVGSLYGLAVRVVGFAAPIIGLALFLGGVGGKRLANLSLLFLMFLLTDLSIRQRSFSDTSLDPQNILKLSVWGLGLFVALFNIKILRASLSNNPPLGWLLLFAVWCLATTVYSPIPAYTFGCGVAFISMIVFAAVIRQQVSEAILLKLAIATFLLLTLSALVMYVVAPTRAMALMENGSILRLAGPFGSPNNLGRTAAILVLLCSWAYHRNVLSLKSSLLITAMLSSLACIYLSQSRTAGIAVFSAVLLALSLRRPIWLFVGMSGLLAVTLLLSIFEINTEDVARLISRTGRAYEVATMTGRTDIWKFVWGEILKEPIFGYGFASTNVIIPLGYRTFWGWTTSSAHNMWLQVWITTGLIGVILLIIAFISQGFQAYRSKDLVSGSLLIFIFVLGMAEPGPSGPGAPNILTLVWALWAASNYGGGAGAVSTENKGQVFRSEFRG